MQYFRQTYSQFQKKLNHETSHTYCLWGWILINKDERISPLFYVRKFFYFPRNIHPSTYRFRRRRPYVVFHWLTTLTFRRDACSRTMAPLRRAPSSHRSKVQGCIISARNVTCFVRNCCSFWGLRVVIAEYYSGKNRLLSIGESWGKKDEK